MVKANIKKNELTLSFRRKMRRKKYKMAVKNPGTLRGRGFCLFEEGYSHSMVPGGFDVMS